MTATLAGTAKPTIMTGNNLAASTGTPYGKSRLSADEVPRSRGEFRQIVLLERFNLSYLRWYSVGMKPTSNDLRRRVVAARVEDGQSMGQIAERFRMPKGTVQNIIERYRDAGTVEPKPHNAGRKPAISGQALRKLERDVLQHSDATLCELRDRCGLDVSLVTVHNTLKRRGFTRKKRLYVQVSSADETSSQREGPGVKD